MYLLQTDLVHDIVFTLTCFKIQTIDLPGVLVWIIIPIIDGMNCRRPCYLKIRKYEGSESVFPPFSFEPSDILLKVSII